MSILSLPLLPVQSVRREHLGPLAVYLKSHGYAWVEEALKYVARNEGDLSGMARADLVDPDDLEDAELAMEAGFDGVPYYSGEWDESHVWNATDAVSLTPPDLDDSDFPDAPDHAATRQPGYWDALAADGVGRLPAVSGGAPEGATLTPPEVDALYEAFEPSDADRAEFSAWLHEGEMAAKSDDIETMRRWYESRPDFYTWLADNGGPA